MDGPFLQSRIVVSNPRMPHLTGPEELEELTGDFAFSSPNEFFFQERRDVLDLRQLARVDVPKLIREVDVDLLNSHLENITFYNLRGGGMMCLCLPFHRSTAGALRLI
jgi:hypothetical protein